MNKLTIGVTAVGSGIGQPVLDSLRDADLFVRVIGFEASAWGKGAYECDAVYRLPLANAPSYREVLLARCQESGIQVLIPGSDTELIPLAEAAPALDAIGCQVIVSRPECVHTCRDKLALYHHLEQVGFPFVRTWLLEEARARAEELPYPVIAKPRGGSGSVGAQVVLNPAGWARLALEGDWIVQPYLIPAVWDNGSGSLEGYMRQLTRTGRPVQRDELSIQVMVSDEGRLLGRFASVNRLKDGVVMTVNPLDDAEVWRWTDRFVEAMVPLGLRGPCNLQGRITSEGMQFFEANSRFTGITHVRALMGYNEVEAAVRHFVLHEDHATVKRCLPQVTDRVGLRQMTEIAVPRVHLERFEQEGEWAINPPFGVAVITGATGYLGQALAQKVYEERLARRIILPVRDPARARALWPDDFLTDRLELVPWRLADPLPGLEQADLVIHAAAVRPVPSTDPADWYRVNVEGTRRLVQAVQKARVPYALFLSSQSVYGTQQLPPWEEATPLCPETPYAHSKAAGEALMQMLAGGPTHWAIMRLARLYGLASQIRWGELPHRFAALTAHGDRLTIHGDGEQRMDLLHIQDGVSALVHLLRCPFAWDGIYNVGGGQPVSVNELAEACAMVAAAEGMPAPIVDRVPASGVTPSFGMTIERMARIGWQPQVSIEMGLTDLIRAARK